MTRNNFHQIGPSIVCLCIKSISKLVKKIPSNKSLNYHNIYQYDPLVLIFEQSKKTDTLIVENTIINHTFDVHKSLHSQRRTLYSHQVISLTFDVHKSLHSQNA